MLCLHLQIVYFPGQYQLREWRGEEEAWIGMEVKVAVRWGDGGRMDAEKSTNFTMLCKRNALVFSSSLLSGSPPALTPSSFISRAVKAVSGGSSDAACQGANMIRNTHSAHRVSCEAHLHPILQRDGPSLYNYKEARTGNLYLSALMIKLPFLSFSPSQLCTVPLSFPLFSSSAALTLTRPPYLRSIPNARVLRGHVREPLDKI